MVRRSCGGAVERGLDGGLELGCGSVDGRDVRGPGKDDARERFGDEETVPGGERPGAVRHSGKGADPGCADQLGELYGAGLGDHRRPSRAIDGEGADVAISVGFGHLLQRGGAAARGRAANGAEAEPLDGARDQLAIEAARDEDGDAAAAEAVRAHQQGAVPEGVDRGAGDLVARGARGGCRFEAVLVAQGRPEQADEQRGERRDDRQGEALAEGVRHRPSL